jgi:hypothetical protein
LDTTYGNSGFFVYNSGAYGQCLEIDTNQKMVVGTYNMSQTFKFYRFTSSNQLDTTFGSGGSTTVNLGGVDAVLYDMKNSAQWENCSSRILGKCRKCKQKRFHNHKT